MRTINAFVLLGIGAAFLLLPATTTEAYDRYNDGCQNCHGDFTGSISPKGSVFPNGDKHRMHRDSASMDTECDLCHTNGDGRDPFIGSSNGTANNTGYGCTGCHGRLEDAGNDGLSPGLGAGLRQHHHNTGITACAGCHTDANPANYTPVGEDIKPPYFGTVDTKADMSCNPGLTSNENENWTINDFVGLDNDGDVMWDAIGDPDCMSFIKLVALPNIGGSAAPELGAALSGSLNGFVRDASTDALIGSQTFNADRTPLDVGVADINGAPAMAILGKDASGRAWVEVRDAATGTLVRDVWFSSGYSPIALAVLPDMDGNSISEVAVLMTKPSDNDRTWVHIKDASTLAVVSTVWFQSGYTPLDLEFVPNVDGNPGPELAVLMTRDSDGRTWVHTKDAQTGAPVKDNWFAAAHTPKDLAVIDNLDGNPGAELAVLFSRDSDSRTWVHMKDTLTGAYVKNVWFDAGFTPTRLEVVPDLDTNVGDELAVLTTKDADGRAWVLVKDALSGAVIRNVWFQGGFAPKDFAVLPEMDANAGAELAVLGEKTGGQVQVEIKDAKTNAFINQVNFP